MAHVCPRSWLLLAIVGLCCACAQGQDAASQKKTDSERWNFHAQITAIGETHGTFRSPYADLNSLQARRESRTSLTTTFFAGVRPWKGGEIYLNPEIAGGKGLSGVEGLAGFPNGDITRVVSATPKLYLSRVYLRQTWDLGGGETEAVEPGANQLGGRQPVRRVSVYAGKLSVTDLFDTNVYSHDPRTQFMNWALMDSGTFDFPADTRGYTWGLAVELNQGRWAIRAGSFMVPRLANGLELDTHLRRNHGEVVEVEGRWSHLGQPGKIRLLGWVNHANMGTYREALQGNPTKPDITLTRRAGTAKYGLGLSFEQALNRDVGAFARLGWDDGKTETWTFTEIDRTFHLGIQFNGRHWVRPQDVLAVALTDNGLSRDHRDYLAAGGLGFQLGDGRLSYGAERIVEAYYALKLQKRLTVTLDYQRAQNPGDNRDRGPVSIWGLRLHWEY